MGMPNADDCPTARAGGVFHAQESLGVDGEMRARVGGDVFKPVDAVAAWPVEASSRMRRASRG
jgi:hypothetical protein